MNRFSFLGAQKDEQGVEWVYVLDTQANVCLKLPVRTTATAASTKVNLAGPSNETGVPPMFPVDTVTAPVAVSDPTKPFGKPDPEGELETAEQRAYRLAHPKVPAAFSVKMNMDPGKTGGVTDVTQTH